MILWQAFLKKIGEASLWTAIVVVCIVVSIFIAKMGVVWAARITSEIIVTRLEERLDPTCFRQAEDEQDIPEGRLEPQ